MRDRRFFGRLDEKFNPFEDDYLAEIVGATAKAWSLMRKPRRGEIEDRITFRLVGKIQHDPAFRMLPYDVYPQHELVGPEGERLGRLDIFFKHRHSKRDYLAFEAKRLHVRYPGGKLSTEYPTYVGQAGMMAFVVNQYAEGLPVGGMLAYVMDGLTDKAWSGIAARIEASRADLQMGTGETLLQSQLSAAIKTIPKAHLGETLHGLKRGQFRILHLILAV